MLPESRQGNQYLTTCVQIVYSVVPLLSTDLKGTDKFWFPSLKASKFDLSKSKRPAKNNTDKKIHILLKVYIFFHGKVPSNIFLLKKEQEMSFGSNPHLCYFSGSSHRGEREVLQVNLLW